MAETMAVYTPNPGDVKALSLRYQIPLVDFGMVQDELMACTNLYAMAPDGGHPQACGHYLWFKQLERAFECWDPIGPGQAQLHLPERVHPNSRGWEGRMTTYDEKSGRVNGTMFIFDDTAINCWGTIDEGKESGSIFVDGQAHATRRSMPGRSTRNSLFRFGRTRLGDRHILELTGKTARLTAVDAKTCLGRRWLGVEAPGWKLDGAKPAAFRVALGLAVSASSRLCLRRASRSRSTSSAANLSVAYVDSPGGGTLKVTVDGQSKLKQPAKRAVSSTRRSTSTTSRTAKAFWTYPTGVTRSASKRPTGPSPCWVCLRTSDG